MDLLICLRRLFSLISTLLQFINSNFEFGTQLAAAQRCGNNGNSFFIFNSNLVLRYFLNSYISFGAQISRVVFGNHKKLFY